MSEAQSIQINDTPLVSMVLVDDENNRTTFNGPIINDFTITEDLQSKINQLTTLATNIGNLQTRLQNITNILNTQNIEFDNGNYDISSADAGSKLYIRPQVSFTIETLRSSDPYIKIVRYLNLTPYVTGKYEFTQGVSLDVTCSLSIDFNFYPTHWNMYLAPDSITGLMLNVGGTIESIASLAINTIVVYENGAVTGNIGVPLNPTTITITSVSGSVGTINITFTK